MKTLLVIIAALIALSLFDTRAAAFVISGALILWPRSLRLLHASAKDFFMINKISVAAIALSISAASALAADLPSIKGPLSAAPLPPPLWTGFYIGANAGGIFGGDNLVKTVTSPAIDNIGNFGLFDLVGLGANSAALATGSLETNNGGFIGGGQIGYNWQFNESLVAGIEADIQGVAGARGSNNAATILPSDYREHFFFFGGRSLLASTLSSSKGLDYLGTVRGRLGYLVIPTLLVYATGGLAYGQANASAGILQAASYVASEGCRFCQVPVTYNLVGGGGAYGTLSDTRIGWTVGGGLEWLFLPNWSAKVEYLYYDLGNATYALSPLALTAAISSRFLLPPSSGLATVGFPVSSTRFNGNVVRAGVNYHFNWGAAPVVASE